MQQKNGIGQKARLINQMNDAGRDFNGPRRIKFFQ